MGGGVGGIFGVRTGHMPESRLAGGGNWIGMKRLCAKQVKLTANCGAAELQVNEAL